MSATHKNHFITFYTKGFSVDGIGCQDLRSQEKTVEELVSKSVDVYKSYSYGEVKEMCPEAVHNFGYFFMPNEHSGFMGFFRWKPWIIKHHLTLMNDGDVLIYRDVNLTKYVQYRDGMTDIVKTADWILSKLEVPLFVPIERENCKIKNYVKRSAFMLMNMAYEDIKGLPLLYTPIIVLKKTELVCQIIDEWWDSCCIPGIVQPIHEGVRHEDFRHHTCSTAVLNLLLRKKQLDGVLPYDHFRYYLSNRIFTMEGVHLYYPEKERPDGKWKCINKFHHQDLVPYYSGDMIYYKVNNLWVLNLMGGSPFKWVGYEYSQPGRYRVSFEILFKNYVPDMTHNVGFKVHFPKEKLHNLWLNDMKVDEWKHVELVVQKITGNEELMILIFDGLSIPNVIHVRDFLVRRY